MRVLALAIGLMLVSGPAAAEPSASEDRAAAELARVRDNPLELRAFLKS